MEAKANVTAISYDMGSLLTAACPSFSTIALLRWLGAPHIQTQPKRGPLDNESPVLRHTCGLFACRVALHAGRDYVERYPASVSATLSSAAPFPSPIASLIMSYISKAAVCKGVERSLRLSSQLMNKFSQADARQRF